MEDCKVNGLTPFIPAQDFDLSRRFYLDLGFTELAPGAKSALFGIGPFGFWLQDYYVKEWAENCMLCLYVEKLSPTERNSLAVIRWHS